MTKPFVLWVEDSARFELAHFMGPIYASRKYDITLAEDATTAARYLQTLQFDVIILDIRLPPGNDQYWGKVYERAGSDKAIAQLGLALLNWLFAPDPSDKKKPAPPKPIKPAQIGVFSVEGATEIGQNFAQLGIVNFLQKRPGLQDTILLEFIETILVDGKARHERNSHVNPA